MGRSHDFVKDTTSRSIALTLKLDYRLGERRIDVLTKYERKRTVTEATSLVTNLELRFKSAFGNGVTTFGDYTSNRFEGESETRASFALAYRPIFTDKIDLFAQYETEIKRTLPRQQVVSVEAIYMPLAKVTLFGKYASKRHEAMTNLSLFIMRLSYQFVPHLDLTGEGRISKAMDGERFPGYAIEIGYQHEGHLRFAFGYRNSQSQRFNATEHQNGVYLKIGAATTLD